MADEDSVLSQEDPPSGVKKADQSQHARTKVPSGQLSGTPSARTTAMRADLPQRSPRADNPQQTKDKSRKDHLQAPKEALDAPSYNQQSTAQDEIYVIVQPMPTPGTIGIPYLRDRTCRSLSSSTNGYASDTV